MLKLKNKICAAKLFQTHNGYVGILHVEKYIVLIVVIELDSGIIRFVQNAENDLRRFEEYVDGI